MDVHAHGDVDRAANDSQVPEGLPTVPGPVPAPGPASAPTAGQAIDPAGDDAAGDPSQATVLRSVDDVVASVEALDGVPVDEHVVTFEQAHERLRRALDGRVG